MRFDPDRCFDLTHTVVTHDDVTCLRLDVTLLLWDAGEERFSPVRFRIDSGSDVSVVARTVTDRLMWPTEPWPGRSALRTSSGDDLRIERVAGVRYRFPRLPAFTFRTDFAVADELPADFGLLAWRDLAFDFGVRTLHLPRLDPLFGQVFIPGTQQFCLRPDAERFPGRVGQMAS